jgi:hypothetical protein
VPRERAEDHAERWLAPTNGATAAGVYGPNARGVPLCLRQEAVRPGKPSSVLFLVAAFVQDWLEGKPQ